MQLATSVRQSSQSHCLHWTGPESSHTSMSLRMPLAASVDRAKMSTPDTDLSSLCTGNSFPSCGCSASRMLARLFLRYCPDTCTGMLAGLPTATKSAVWPRI